MTQEEQFLDERAKVLAKVACEQYAQGRKGGLDAARRWYKNNAHEVDVLSGLSVSAERSARWRASRRLARKLHEHLVQLDVDKSERLCYRILIQIDHLRDLRNAT